MSWYVVFNFCRVVLYIYWVLVVNVKYISSIRRENCRTKFD